MRGGLTLGPSKRYLGTQPSPIFDRMPLFAPVVWSRYLQWRKLEWCILPNSQRWIQRRCNPSNCENFCRKGQFGWFGEGDPQDEWTCFVQNSKCSRYIQRSLPYNKMKITMSYTELNNNWRPFGLVRSLSNRSNAIFFSQLRNWFPFGPKLDFFVIHPMRMKVTPLDAQWKVTSNDISLEFLWRGYDTGKTKNRFLHITERWACCPEGPEYTKPTPTFWVWGGS